MQKERREISSRIPIVIQMLIFMTMGNFNDSSYSPLSTFIKNSFLLNYAEVGAITSAIFLGTVIVSLISGFLVDRLGPYTATKISFGIIATGAAVTFLAHSYALLIVGFFLIGFGYGILTPSTNSPTMKEYYPHHATRMGLKQSGVPIGAGLSAAVLPIIALNFSLRGSFLLMLLIAGVMALILPRERNSREKMVHDQSYFRDLLSAGSNKSLVVIAVSTVFLSWGQQTVLTFFVPFQEHNGISVILAEVLLVTLLVGSVFGRLFWAYVSDRVFRRNRVRTLSLIMALAGFMFVIFRLSGDYLPIAMAFAFVIGMNAVGWNSIFVTLVSEVAPKEKVGLFSGISIMLTGLGTIIGTPISGRITDSLSFVPMWMVLGSVLMVMSVVFLVVGGKYVRPSRILEELGKA